VRSRDAVREAVGLDVTRIFLVDGVCVIDAERVALDQKSKLKKLENRNHQNDKSAKPKSRNFKMCETKRDFRTSKDCT
jgi:hypothetical protein